MSRRALSANAGAPLIEPRMHCRRNSVGDQCEWPGYLPAAKHQIDSRVSSAPASSPAYLQRRPLHAAAGLPPPWPCSGPAAVLLRQSQRAGTGSAERLVLRDHALPVREGPYRRPRPVSWHEHLRGRAVRLDGDHAAGLVPRIPPGHRRRRVLVLDQGAGSRRRQQGRTGRARPHRTRQYVHRAVRRLHGFPRRLRHPGRRGSGIRRPA